MIDIDRISGELKYIKSVSRSVPAYALYIAGYARSVTNLDPGFLMKILEAYFQKMELNLIDQDRQKEIEASIFEGKIGLAKRLIFTIPSLPDRNALIEDLVIKDIEPHVKNALSCKLCPEFLSLSEAFIPSSCLCTFHGSCLLQYSQKLEENICPSCNKNLTYSDLQHLSDKSYSKIFDLSLMPFISDGSLVTCPNCEILLCSSQETTVCPSCKNTLCMVCHSFRNKCRCSILIDHGIGKPCPNCKTVNLNAANSQIVTCRECEITLCFDCNKFIEHCSCYTGEMLVD